MIGGDEPGRGLEIPVGVFGVDPALDGVTPEIPPVSLEADRLSRRHPDLLLHEVEAGDHLGDRMLDLDPGVHLHEVEPPVDVEEKLQRAGTDVADVRRQRHRRLAHALAEQGLRAGLGLSSISFW